MANQSNSKNNLNTDQPTNQQITKQPNEDPNGKLTMLMKLQTTLNFR